MIVYSGGPRSGKSGAAENRACEIAGGREKIYLAAMIPFGNEGAKRIRRHRSMRAGKGFLTVERPYDVAGIEEEIIKDRVVLLECAANLAANEIFERGRKPGEELAEQLFSDILRLEAKARELIVVTDKFSTDSSYDAETISYIRTLDLLNSKLREAAGEEGYYEFA